MSIRNVGKQLERWGAVCGLIFAGFCLSGCRTQSPEQQFAEVPPALTSSSGGSSAPAPAPQPSAASATAPVAAPATTAVTGPAAAPMASPAATSSNNPEADVLRVGYSLVITFTDTPTLIPNFEGPIGEDGNITLTYNQTFKAEGKTQGELAKEIRARYVPSIYKYMTVLVKQAQDTRWYYVDGEVRSPNRQIYTSRLTVSKAITSAGGFTDFANKKKVKLNRADGRTLTVNCVKALDNPSLDPEVYPGDKIHVPRRIW